EYPSLEIKGAAKYNAPDGTPVEFSYIANENGYQPIGSFIPATPDYVIRSLAYIEAHPPQDKPQASGYKPQASGYKPQSASPFQG
ncbi:Cuticular protein CPR2, partial [Operophtera brumata]